MISESNFGPKFENCCPLAVYDAEYHSKKKPSQIEG